jgi:hypothetical protein
MPAPAVAASLPTSEVPESVGVNIHFTTGHERDLDLIAAAGIRWVRMDFHWASIERERGVYDWSAYDELTANLEHRGLGALYILDYSNPLHEETVTSPHPITGKPHSTVAAPRRPESIAAFARWAAAAAQRYAGRKVLWEIWNEPNGHFWPPAPNVTNYTALALATAAAIRALDPDAVVLAPATSGFPWDFLDAFLGSGVLAHLGGVTVHPYRPSSQPPETVGPDYVRLRALLDRHAPADRKGKIPVLSGEWGYPTHTGGVSLETQAAFVARQQLVNLLHGVPLSIWYDWKNDGDDPAEREHNFGLVRPNLQPKPAYHALRTLTRELARHRFALRYDTGRDADFALVFTNAAGGAKLAAWTLGAPREISLRLSIRTNGALSLVSGLGATQTVRVRDGAFVLQLTGLPQYLDLGRAALALPPRRSSAGRATGSAAGAS